MSKVIVLALVAALGFVSSAEAGLRLPARTALTVVDRELDDLGESFMDGTDGATSYRTWVEPASQTTRVRKNVVDVDGTFVLSDDVDETAFACDVEYRVERERYGNRYITYAWQLRKVKPTRDRYEPDY